MDSADELVSCPRCGLPADIIPSGPNDDFPHSKCAAGHDNSLIPSVLEHLRSLAQNERGAA